MIINSVTVENFRSFYGEQTVNFSIDKTRNATLIYALNGVGKTNLLNAILWCLHGIFSPGFKNQNDVLNWAAKARNRKSYHVSVEFEENNDRYVVKRSGGDISAFKVFRVQDGNYVEISRSSAFVNSIIPKDMASYFINDGEGSAFTVNAAGLISIRRSIRDILGFNVAEGTLENLKKIKKELRDELSTVDASQELAESQSKLNVFEESISTNQTKFDEEKLQLSTYTERLSEIDTQLGGASSAIVNNLSSQRKKAVLERDRVSASLRSAEAKKILLIREYSWAAFSHSLSAQALDFIDDTELKGTIPAPFHIQLVKDILDDNKCICGACVPEGSEAFKKIEALLDKGADPELLNRLQRARSRLTAIQTLAPQGKERLTEIYRDISSMEARMKELDKEIEDFSEQIESLDDENVRKLESERKSLTLKQREAQRTVDRLEDKILELNKNYKELKARVSRLEGLSPRAQVLSKRISVLESSEELIKQELIKAESEIFTKVEDRINQFLKKYLRQDYSAFISEEMQVGYKDRNGNLVPPSGGQSAILAFIYISSLIQIARERRDEKSNILTPGAIAPLIFDAPFSHLAAEYAENIAKELPDLVDQLVIFMYQDDGKPIDKVLLKNGKLGKMFYLTEEIAGPKDAEKTVQFYSLQGEKIPASTYDCSIDKVLINEVDLND